MRQRSLEGSGCGEQERTRRARRKGWPDNRAARPEHCPRDRSADTYDRVRADHVGTTGTVTLRTGGELCHIGIGRTHAGTHVLLLIQDLNIRIINAATGELIHELTLDSRPQLPAHRSTQRTSHKTQAPNPDVGSGP